MRENHQSACHCSQTINFAKTLGSLGLGAWGLGAHQRRFTALANRFTAQFQLKKGRTLTTSVSSLDSENKGFSMVNKASFQHDSMPPPNAPPRYE